MMQQTKILVLIKEWSHIKGLQFPKMGPEPIVDVLIVQICIILTDIILEVNQDNQLPGLHGHVLVLCKTYLSQNY